MRFGYKLWAVCEVSGYCHSFDFYGGNSSKNDDDDNLLLETKNVRGCKSAKFSLFSLTTGYDLLVHLRNSVIKPRVQSEETD